MTAGQGPALVTAGALLVLAVGLSLGIAGPFLWGHDGFNGAVLMGSARAWLRAGAPGPPVLGGLNEMPLRASDYYLHHPLLAYGLHWLFAAVLGPGAFAARLLGAFSTMLAGFALLGIGRREGGPWTGALALAFFAILPSTMAYGLLAVHEIPGTALALIGLHAYREGRLRVAWLFLALALNCAWVSYYLGGVIGVHAAWKRRTGFAAALLATALVSFGGLLAVVHALGHWDEFWSHAGLRGTQPRDWGVFLARMGDWALKNFGPVLPLLGLGGLFCQRSVALTALLALGLGHYVVFTQLGFIHVYYQHAFAPFVALGAAHACVRLFDAPPDTRSRRAAGAVLAAALAATLPFTVGTLVESRRLAATVAQRGAEPWDVRNDLLAVARFVGGHTAPQQRVAALPWELGGVEFQWHAGVPVDRLRRPDPVLADDAPDRWRWIVAETAAVAPAAVAALDARHAAYDFGRYRAWDPTRPEPGTRRCPLRPAPVALAMRWLAYPFHPKLVAECGNL